MSRGHRAADIGLSEMQHLAAEQLGYGRCTRLAIWWAVLNSANVRAAVLEERGLGCFRVRVAGVYPDLAKLEAEEALYWHAAAGMRWDVMVDQRIDGKDMMRLERARHRRWRVEAGTQRRIGGVVRALWDALMPKVLR